uniref:Uncharacterized protein n=1 Tax=Panagrolaimus davidi TaxID=227884 RepID=A0A914PW66_9BILA
MDLSACFKRVSFSTPICNLKRETKDVKIVPFPKPAQVFATYFRQDFSMPDSIMFYIAKNPKSSKLYEEIIQTCKYFFATNPICVVYRLRCSSENKWYISFLSFKRTKEEKQVDLRNIDCKFWITDVFTVDPLNKEEKNVVSMISPKIYVSCVVLT